MKIYDKAAWHIDAGESSGEVISKLNTVMSFLHEKKLLSDYGEELLELGIDKSISLHEQMVTPDGRRFLEKSYDSIINLSSDVIRDALDEAYKKNS